MRDTQRRTCLLGGLDVRLTSSVGDHFRQPLVEKIIQFRLRQWAKAISSGQNTFREPKQSR